MLAWSARFAIIAVLVVGCVQSALAHQSSVTYVEADVAAPPATTVQLRVRLAPRDLSEALGLGDAAQSPAALIAGREAAIHALVSGRVIVTATATATATGTAVHCPPATAPAVTVDGERIAVVLTARCPAPPARLTITYDLLFDLDRNHTAALRVRVPGRRAADTLLSRDERSFTWDLSHAPPSGAPAFIRQGIHHVVTGFDHIAFVLALLLAVVLTRSARGDLGASSPAAGGGTWTVRRIGPAVRTTAGVVSAFTVAHSLTLIAAALGWVSLPGRLVEATIAASIILTAIASVLRPEARWRLLTAFGFGLVHGLGFARMLAELLPPTDIVVPLLCFNLGVELAQLAIVAVAVPLAWLLARALGAPRYRAVALPALAAPLVILGAIWLIERLADVTILGL